MSDFLIKIQNGFKIMVLSYKLFFKRPKYLFFPIINLLILMFFITSMFMIIYFTTGFEKNSARALSFSNKLLISSAFIWLSIMGSFFFTLISVATSFFSIKALENNDITLSAAINHSLEKSKIILQWAIVNVTIGIILDLFKNKNNRLVAGILSGLASLAGLAWNVATFFIFPVIAFENLGIFASIKHSAITMKKTFGESAIAFFSFGIVEMITLFCCGYGTFWLTTIVFNDILIPLNFVSANQNNLKFIVVVTPTLFVISFIISITSTVKTIFKTAVYAYGTNRPTGIFPPELISSSFGKH